METETTGDVEPRVEPDGDAMMPPARPLRPRSPGGSVCPPAPVPRVRWNMTGPVAHRCACGNSWCEKDVDSGGVTVPVSRKADGTIDASAGIHWLRLLREANGAAANARNIERLKEGKRLRIHRHHLFRILHNTIPVDQFDMWGMVFRVCCLLTNYQSPLIRDRQRRVSYR